MRSDVLLHNLYLKNLGHTLMWWFHTFKRIGDLGEVFF